MKIRAGDIFGTSWGFAMFDNLGILAVFLNNSHCTYTENEGLELYEGDSMEHLFTFLKWEYFGNMTD